MDTAQWPQEIEVKPMEEIVQSVACSSKPPPPPSSSSSLERKARPLKDQALNCPRCNSTNTKFCYYNNYSLSQPRYFCKTCRRYWTEGGSLRNIPVGGGSRKNKRSSSSSSSSSSSISTSKKLPDHLIVPPLQIPPLPSQNPKAVNEGQDLNLGFPPDFKTFTELIHVPNFESHNNNNSNNNKENNMISSSSSSTSSQLAALELLTGMTSRGLSPFMPLPMTSDPSAVYSTGFGLADQLKTPSLSFSLDGLGNNNNGFGSLQAAAASQDHNTSNRLLFPFEDLKVSAPSAAATDEQQNKDQGADSTGYWSGVLGGGTW